MASPEVTWHWLGNIRPLSLYRGFEADGPRWFYGGLGRNIISAVWWAYYVNLSHLFLCIIHSPRFKFHNMKMRLSSYRAIGNKDKRGFFSRDCVNYMCSLSCLTGGPLGSMTEFGHFWILIRGYLLRDLEPKNVPFSLHDRILWAVLDHVTVFGFKPPFDRVFKFKITITNVKRVLICIRLLIWSEGPTSN